MITVQMKIGKQSDYRKILRAIEDLDEDGELDGGINLQVIDGDYDENEEDE